jgi:hypothetical protein
MYTYAHQYILLTGKAKLVSVHGSTNKRESKLAAYDLLFLFCLLVINSILLACTIFGAPVQTHGAPSRSPLNEKRWDCEL